MDLHQLRYFRAVAQHLHFTRAAESLNTAQPHVSREIRRLEAELGVTLFVRTSRHVRLTEAGVAFYAHVVPLFTQIDRAVQTARAIDAGSEGSLVVAFPGSVTYSWLPYLVRAFRQRCPKVHLDIRTEMFTGVQVDALSKGLIDVGLLRPPINDPAIEHRTLWHEPLVLALPAGHRLATRPGTIEVADLADEHFITYGGAGSITQQTVLQTCVSAGFVPDTVQTVHDTHSLISLVAAGMGVALVPMSATYFTAIGVTYRALSGEPVMLPLSLGWWRDSPRRTVHSFVQIVEEEARKKEAPKAPQTVLT